MRTVNIRDISGPLLSEAAERQETLGITNGRVLAGVLIPVTQRWVEQLIDQNLSRVVHNIDRGEKEIASIKRLDSLDQLVAEPIAPAMRSSIRRVGIRDIRGPLLNEAAERQETLGITNDGVLVGVLIPVTQRWVEQLIDQNLSRVVHNIDRGEKEIASIKRLDSLDQLVEQGRGSSSGESGTSAATEDPTVAVEGPVIGAPALSLPYDRECAIGVSIRLPETAADPKASHRSVGSLLGVITNKRGEVFNRSDLPLETTDKDVVVTSVASLVGDLRAACADTTNIRGLAVELGGHLNEGRIVYSPNLTWEGGFPIAERLQETTGLVTLVENDANALAAYEWWFGNIRTDWLAVVMITQDGVGCGLILEGRLVHGSTGMAGEFGHIVVEPDKAANRKCRCGNSGCLESVATPHAIMEMVGQGDFEGIVEAAHQGNDRAQAAFRRAGHAMGRGLSILLNLCNPSRVILYGPSLLVGRPRRGPQLADGTPAEIYMESLNHGLKANTFSNAADSPGLLEVRVSPDERGAVGAATTVLRGRVGVNA